MDLRTPNPLAESCVCRRSTCCRLCSCTILGTAVSPTPGRPYKPNSRRFLRILQIRQSGFRDTRFAQIEGIQRTEFLQVQKPRVSHASSVEDQCLEVLQGTELGEPGVRDWQRGQIQDSQLREAAKVYHAGVGHAGSPQPQPIQLRQTMQFFESRIRGASPFQHQGVQFFPSWKKS